MHALLFMDIENEDFSSVGIILLQDPYDFVRK